MSDIYLDEYPFLLRQLTREEGGGFIIEFPDLPGCMSDGDTIEEAIANGRDAALCWIETAKEAGLAIPVPNDSMVSSLSGKWVQRAPKSLHAALVLRAKREDVSLNTLVVSMISEGLGKRAYDVPNEKISFRERRLASRSKKPAMRSALKVKAIKKSNSRIKGTSSRRRGSPKTSGRKRDVR
jgi:antitoxin HicB